MILVLKIGGVYTSIMLSLFLSSLKLLVQKIQELNLGKANIKHKIMSFKMIQEYFVVNAANLPIHKELLVGDNS